MAFLAASCLTLLLLLTSSPWPSLAVDADVVVIGAGVSGLAAASTLTARGYRVVARAPPAAAPRRAAPLPRREEHAQGRAAGRVVTTGGRDNPPGFGGAQPDGGADLDDAHVRGRRRAGSAVGSRRLEPSRSRALPRRTA